eukprot:6319-Heterococcus_DN1.PRE.6
MIQAQQPCHRCCAINATATHLPQSTVVVHKVLASTAICYCCSSTTVPLHCTHTLLLHKSCLRLKHSLLAYSSADASTNSHP